MDLWALGYAASVYYSVFVTSVKCPSVLATNSGKVIDNRDANPCKEGIAQARRHELEGCRFEYPGKQNIFLYLHLSIIL